MRRSLTLLALAALAVPVCCFGQQRPIEPFHFSVDGTGFAPAPDSPLLAQATSGAPRARPIFSVGGRVERPEIRVGDLWRFQVTDRLTRQTEAVSIEVMTVTESRIQTWSSRSSSVAAGPPAAAGVIETWDREWNQFSTGNIVYVPFYPAVRFPLEPGMKWTVATQWNSGSGILKHDLTTQVAGWERVTVPAGTFDAIRLNVRGYISETATTNYYAQTGTISNVLWYAPVIGQIVKKEIGHIDNSPIALGRLSERWELVEYRPY